MRVFPILSCLLASVWTLSASEVRHDLKRHSELEQELAYKLVVQDKHDDWRAQGFDKVFPIVGAAAEYSVRFDATTNGKLKELFGLTLELTDATGVLLVVPLETRSKFSDDLARSKGEPVSRNLSVNFVIKKELAAGAILKIRCGTGLVEESYTIHLAEYVPEPKHP